MRSVYRSRLMWLILALCVALIAGAGVVVGAIRSAPPEYVCLRYGTGTLLDLHTGAIATDPRPQPTPDAQPFETTSPDNRYVVTLQALDGMAFIGVYTLIIHPRGGKPYTVIDEMGGSINYVWSPNSDRIAYTWAGSDGKTRVGVSEVSPTGHSEEMRQQLGDAVSFMRWSPDGRYFVYWGLNAGGVFVWSLADQRGYELPPTHGHLADLQWSPDGNWLAYLGSSNNVAWITLATPGGPAYTHELGTDYSTSELFRWSPDSRRVVLQHVRDWPVWWLSDFGIDGSAHLGFDRTAQRGDEIAGAMVTWSADSHSLTYARGQPEFRPRRWDLMSYRPEENQSEALATGLLYRAEPVPPGSGQRLAVAWRDPSSADSGQLAVMDADGANRVTLVGGADDMGAPYWSPDGRYVAAVWATGQGDQRVVRLTWARADGSGAITVDGGFWDVRDLQWLDGLLAYVIWRGDAQGQPTFDAEAADLETGQRRMLIEHVAQISLFDYDAVTQRLQFWWRVENPPAVGADVIDSRANRVQRYRVPTDEPLSIEGSLTRSPYILSIAPGSPGLFPAPDGGVAALKFGPIGDESLYLAFADGSWAREVRSGLSGLGDPLWSPDGARLAFTQSVNGGPVVLSVVAADGREIRTVARSRVYPGLTWTRCD